MNYRKSIEMTIGAGDATSSAIEMTGWRRAGLELPVQTDFSSASADFGFLGSTSITGTYYPLIIDATSHFIASAITLMDSESWPRYMKVGADKTTSSSYAAKLHVSD